MPCLELEKLITATHQAAGIRCVSVLTYKNGGITLIGRDMRDAITFTVAVKDLYHLNEIINQEGLYQWLIGGCICNTAAAILDELDENENPEQP